LPVKIILPGIFRPCENHPSTTSRGLNCPASISSMASLRRGTPPDIHHADPPKLHLSFINQALWLMTL
jgi:hypothetical protein